MQSFTSIVITGASSGIGEALALDYAAPGVALALSGRDGPRLEAVAAACRAKGATVDTGRIDVANRAELAAWLTNFDDAHPVDLVIANAGISIDKDNAAIADFSIVRRTFDVNFAGAINTIEPLVSRMRARGTGQLALVSSLAGFIGLPYSAAYSASKAAVRVLGEGLRYGLKKSGIGVSVICPGFVVSRMTATAPFDMPFMMTSERASRIIRNGLARNKARIAFPIPTKAAVWLATLLPAGWIARLLGA